MKKKFNFWLWLIRLAYRKMKGNQPTLPTGIPGMRDPEAPCTGYAPRKRVLGDYASTCETDGHYLCKECLFNTKINTTHHG